MEIKNYEMSASISIPEYITSRGYFVFVGSSEGVVGIKKDAAGRWNIVKGPDSELSLFTSCDWIRLAKTTEQSFYIAEDNYALDVFYRYIGGIYEGIASDGGIKVKTDNLSPRFGLFFLYSDTKNITPDYWITREKDGRIKVVQDPDPTNSDLLNTLYIKPEKNSFKDLLPGESYGVVVSQVRKMPEGKRGSRKTLLAWCSMDSRFLYLHPDQTNAGDQVVCIDRDFYIGNEFDGKKLLEVCFSFVRVI
jgi:hypothetical protein